MIHNYLLFCGNETWRKRKSSFLAETMTAPTIMICILLLLLLSTISKRTRPVRNPNQTQSRYDVCTPTSARVTYIVIVLPTKFTGVQIQSSWYIHEPFFHAIYSSNDLIFVESDVYFLFYKTTLCRYIRLHHTTGTSKYSSAYFLSVAPTRPYGAATRSSLLKTYSNS